MTEVSCLPNPNIPSSALVDLVKSPNKEVLHLFQHIVSHVNIKPRKYCQHEAFISSVGETITAYPKTIGADELATSELLKIESKYSRSDK